MRNRITSDFKGSMNRTGPTILTRIMIGYLAIFIPLAAMSAYAFSQLARSRSSSDAILKADNHMKDLVQKIADSMLAQVRFERKYIITKDPELIHQFTLAEEDVRSRIGEATSIADNVQKREVLQRIGNDYEHYRSVFEEEIQLVKDKQPYDDDRYKEEKKKTIDGILTGLKNLKLYSEQDAYEKMERLGESGEKANEIAIAVASGFVLLGIIISIFITRSITIPITYMSQKTRLVAKGDFDMNLDLSSPPEIGELAKDFNLMCDKLKATDKMKADFFSLMAHELRTPVACIKEGTSLLQNHTGADFEKKREEILSIITEESNRLADLVNALLDLSKMEAGMIAMNFEKSDIGPLVHKAVSGLGPLAMTKNVAVLVDVQQDLPQVKMDAERILQALRNLIGNAVKFTPGGGRVVISAGLSEKGLQISIADTGPGIAKQDLQAIFDKFRQGTMTDYNKIKGTGLGLAMVKHIINVHGGIVWVESELGQGSLFTFVLPV